MGRSCGLGRPTCGGMMSPRRSLVSDTFVSGLPLMQYSILHISDLHRDLTDEVENGPLLESILRDVRNYPNQKPPILQPSVCIASGDLIYGLKPDTKDSDS